MKRKVTIILICIMIASLILTGCGEQVKISKVERVNSFGYKGVGEATARAGYDILLIAIKSKEEISSFGSELVLKDGNGNRYPCAGMFSSKYIFEVPESADNLILVVNDSLEVKLP